MIGGGGGDDDNYDDGDDDDDELGGIGRMIRKEYRSTWKDLPQCRFVHRKSNMA
jgi:hypothetical protein